jgi:hypothetical protein
MIQNGASDGMLVGYFDDSGTHRWSECCGPGFLGLNPNGLPYRAAGNPNWKTHALKKAKSL